MISRAPMWIPEKIISSGQTGAGIGALCGAERCKILTGGCAPRNFKTESGSQPLLGERFGLIPHPSPRSRDSRLANVTKSDAVVIFARFPVSEGTVLAIELCVSVGRAWCLLNPDVDGVEDAFASFVQSTRPRVLHISGNRESAAPGIAKQVAGIVTRCFFHNEAGVYRDSVL